MNDTKMEIFFCRVLSEIEKESGKDYINALIDEVCSHCTDDGAAFSRPVHSAATALVNFANSLFGEPLEEKSEKCIFEDREYVVGADCIEIDGKKIPIDDEHRVTKYVYAPEKPVLMKWVIDSLKKDCPAVLVLARYGRSKGYAVFRYKSKREIGDKLC